MFKNVQQTWHLTKLKDASDVMAVSPSALQLRYLQVGRKPKVFWIEIFRHKCPKRQLAKFIQAKTKEKTWMEQNGSIWLKRPRVAYFNGPENSNLWNATNSNLQNFKVMWFIFLNQPVNMSKSCIYPKYQILKRLLQGLTHCTYFNI